MNRITFLAEAGSSLPGPTVVAQAVASRQTQAPMAANSVRVFIVLIRCPFDCHAFIYLCEIRFVDLYQRT
jgi:hypothetical protein